MELRFRLRRWLRPSVIGYLLLTAGVVAALVASHNDDAETKRAVAAVAANAKRVEEARVERVGQLNRVNQAQCKSLRNLYAVIRKTIEDADAVIESSDYYREHPDEAKTAHARNADTLRRFRSPPCPPDVELPATSG